jgi:MFS family permease
VNAALYGTVYTIPALFVDVAHRYAAGPAGVAAIFSTTLALLLLTGSVAGPLFDRLGPRVLVCAGGLLASAALLAMPYAASVSTAVAVYSGGVGIGAGLCYVPLLATVARSAGGRNWGRVGLAVAGNGVGVIVGPVAGAALNARLGLDGTFRALAVVVAVTGPVAAVLAGRVAPRSLPSMHTTAPMVTAARVTAFVRFWIAGFLGGLCIYIPVLFLPQAALRTGADAWTAAALVSLSGILATLSRLGFGLLTRVTFPARLYAAALVTLTAAQAGWLFAARHYAGLVAVAVVFGIGYGVWVAATSSTAASMVDSAYVGRAVGAIVASGAAGAALGGPIAGWIAQSRGLPAAVALAGAGFAVAALITPKSRVHVTADGGKRITLEAPAEPVIR